MAGTRNHGGWRLAAAISAKAAPEENQDAGRDDDLFGGGEPDDVAQAQQGFIDEDVGPLVGEIKSGGLSRVR